MSILYFDLETTVDWDRADLFLPDLLRKLTDDAVNAEPTGAPLPDPDVIDAQAEMRAALTPEFLKIVGMNLAVDEKEPRSGWVGETTESGEEMTEAMLLNTFWRMAEKADHIVGFNCLRFDLPAILVRSAILGVFPTVPFFAFKPWEMPIVDLAQKRVQFGRFEKGQWHSLKALRRLYNLPIPKDLQEVALMDGGDVGALYEQWHTALAKANEEAEDGDPVAAEILMIEANTALTTLKNYGKLDIVTTRELCRFWGGYFHTIIAARRTETAKEQENSK